MQLERPPAIVREEAADLIACLVRAKGLLAHAERSSLECGRELVRAREMCIRQGRPWLAELDRMSIPRTSAQRYMQAAMDADNPPDESGITQVGNGGQGESEESQAESDDGDEVVAAVKTPVARRPSAAERLESAPDTPKTRFIRRALEGLDIVEQSVAPIGLPGDYPDLKRLRRDLERASS